MKVLAVDDDTIILELLDEAFTIFGHTETVTASSAEAALTIIKDGRTRVDCFVLDIQMPGMDGIELCKRIRAMRFYARTPIIMLTAMSQTEYIERAFAAGATDYLTKPFDFLELAFRLQMAERLASEIHKVSEGRGELAKMRRIIGTPSKPSIDHPYEIGNVEGAIGYVAFENYIMQLSRGSQFASSVFAVRIDNIKKIYSSASASEYIHVLSSVAKAISSYMREEGVILSYRGNGEFVCVCHTRAGSTSNEIRLGIERFLRISQDWECRGRSLTVSVGKRASIGAIFKFRALQSIHRAIANLENLDGEKANVSGRASGNQRAGIDAVAPGTLDLEAIEDMLCKTLRGEVALIHRATSAPK